MGGVLFASLFSQWCPIILATQVSRSTWTNWTSPRAKFCFDWCHCRYCCSGSSQRLLTAITKPLPQPPMSLQIWTMILLPAPAGLVASPLVYVISFVTHFELIFGSSTYHYPNVYKNQLWFNKIYLSITRKLWMPKYFNITLPTNLGKRLCSLM